MRVSVVKATPWPLYPQKQNHYSCYRRLVRHHGQSVQVHKISPPQTFDPWTILTIGGCYTGYTVLGHYFLWYWVKAQFLFYVFTDIKSCLPHPLSKQKVSFLASLITKKENLTRRLPLVHLWLRSSNQTIYQIFAKYETALLYKSWWWVQVPYKMTQWQSYCP